MKIADRNNIMDFRRIAYRRLPAPVFHYIDGVERGLMLLRSELERTMALLGCDAVDKLGERYIRHRP